MAELDGAGAAVPIDLSPTDTPPPLIVTGTLAFTAFCVASADELAFWVVEDDWVASWAWPEPPHPAVQLVPLLWS